MPTALECPMCGKEPTLQLEGDHHGEYHNLGCSDKDCPAHKMFYTIADSEQSVGKTIEKWNKRYLAPYFEKSVELQSHYAKLLNMYDGGERIVFENMYGFISRIKYLDQQVDKP